MQEKLNCPSFAFESATPRRKAASAAGSDRSTAIFSPLPRLCSQIDMSVLASLCIGQSAPVVARACRVMNSSAPRTFSSRFSQRGMVTAQRRNAVFGSAWHDAHA